MNLAREEAQRLDSEQLGTEHILLGLVEEDSGVAVTVLRSMNIDLAKVRTEVEMQVKTGPPKATMDQVPFTQSAKRVLELSIEEAGKLGYEYIGTEHLLLGLIRENYGIAAKALTKFGVNVEDVRRKVIESRTIAPAEEGAEWESETPIEQALEVIRLCPPSEKETIAILECLRDRFEVHYGVQYTKAALVECTELAAAYLKGHMPGKAIDLLDETGAWVRAKGNHDLHELSKRIQDLERRKVQSILNEEFTKAVQFRDEAYHLSEQLEMRLREQPQGGQSVVADRREVCEAVANRLGVSVEDVEQRTIPPQSFEGPHPAHAERGEIGGSVPTEQVHTIDLRAAEGAEPVHDPALVKETLSYDGRDVALVLHFDEQGYLVRLQFL